MLVLLDHSAPRQLRSRLPEHTVHVSEQLGWARLPDGEMLTLAEEIGYELLITPDQNIKDQQNLSGRKLAILVLIPNDWRVIRRRVADVVAAVNEMGVGEYREISLW